MIEVEVVYCPPGAPCDLRRLSLPEECSLQSALQASGLLERHGLALEGLVVGVWGRRCPADARLREGDRVEVYRPLQCDPKEARRRRHAAQARQDARPRRATADRRAG